MKEEAVSDGAWHPEDGQIAFLQCGSGRISATARRRMGGNPFHRPRHMAMGTALDTPISLAIRGESAHTFFVGCLERRPTRKTGRGGVLPHVAHRPSQEGDE